MPWQLSILLHSLLSGTRAIQNRRIGKSQQDLSLYTLLVSFSLVAALGCLIAVLRSEPIDMDEVWSARFFLFVMAACFSVLNYMTFKLFRKLSASVIAIASLLNPTAVVVIAAIFTSEVLLPRQWVGAIVLLAAVLFVQLRPKKKHKAAKETMSIGVSTLSILIIALLFGVGIVIEKHLLDRLGLSGYLAFGWGSQFIGVLVVVLLLRKKFRLPSNARMHATVWSSGLLLVSAGFLFVLSQVNSDSASLTSLSSTVKVVVTVLLAYIFLKERDRMLQKSIALTLSCIGLFLLFT